MDVHFRNIGLVGRTDLEEVLENILQIAEYLTQKGCHVIFESSLAGALNVSRWQVSSLKAMGEVSDLVIVVGGDGTLLGASRALSYAKTPVVGVNRGQLGFLTDILPGQMEQQLDQILSGQFQIEKRFLLNCMIKRGGKPYANELAFNDVVLHSSEAVQMIEFELFIEGDFVYQQRSDGLIICSPTGSTAYALSAGGPIMHPSLDAITLVPMFPHTLSSRPIVVNANSEIKIVVGTCKNTPPQISCDGQVGIQLAVGDVIYVAKRSHQLTLLHPLSHNFYEACRSKLGWAVQ